MHAATMSDYQLLWWVGFFGIIPDIDILLQRFTAIKHRGIWTHSLYTVLAFTGLILGGWFALGASLPFLNPLTATLTFLATGCHLLGDSLTKTGIPLLAANQRWHFPVVGGHATFDRCWLNAIPLFIAGYIVHAAFGLTPSVLRKLGKWDDVTAYLRKLPR